MLPVGTGIHFFKAAKKLHAAKGFVQFGFEVEAINNNVSQANGTQVAAVLKISNKTLI